MFALRHALVPALLASLVLLPACSRGKPEANCPGGIIPADSASVTRFRDGPGRDLTDVVAEGEIADILIQCKYDKRAVTVDLQIAIAADRGPADRSRVAEFDYWIAILDPQQNIVTKQLARIRFQFSDNRTRLGQIVSDFEPYIPLPDLRKGPEYQILVGFQLTEQELAWNRSNKSR